MGKQRDIHSFSTGGAVRPSRTVVPMRQGPWVNVKQARIYLGGMSRETLRQLERRGRLMPARIGRKVLYSTAEMDAFMSEEEAALEVVEEAG